MSANNPFIAVGRHLNLQASKPPNHQFRDVISLIDEIGISFFHLAHDLGAVRVFQPIS